MGMSMSLSPISGVFLVKTIDKTPILVYLSSVLRVLTAPDKETSHARVYSLDDVDAVRAVPAGRRMRRR